MDRRLFLEFLPGIVFLLANLIWTFFVATAMAIVAAVVAVAIRYRIDRQLPFLAIATVALSVLMFGVGVTLDDENYIKMRPTIGGVAFALILAVGITFKPSLLERSLGYKLLIVPPGWTVLHLGWMALALILALINVVVWQNTTTDFWVTYTAVIGPVAFGIYWLITYGVAWYYWDEDEEEDG